jgi:hypothetical protein
LKKDITNSLDLFFPDESPPDQCKAMIKKKAGRDSSGKKYQRLIGRNTNME